jgi:hydrocephalus-inducing protein
MFFHLILSFLTFHQDYIHELICITEREKFLVPVKAIGARAILDFPDEINFGTAPVKVW